MNGRFRDLSKAIIQSQNTLQSRSFNDQRFDNVCFNIPYDYVEDTTKDRVKFAIKFFYIDTFQKYIPEEKIEEIAKVLYEKNGLDWNEQVTDDKIIINLLDQAKCKDIYSEDIPKKVLSESEGNLQDSAVCSPKKRLKEKEPCLIERTDSRASKTKPLKRQLSTKSKASPPTRVKKVEKNKPYCLQIWDSTNSNIEIDNSPEFESDAIDWLALRPKRVQKPHVNKLPPAQRKNISNNVVTTNNSPVLKSASKTGDLEQSASKTGDLEQSASKTGDPKQLDESRAVKKPRMMNDYREDQDFHHVVTNGDASAPHSNVATLLNMGNTCFLNSVLYTLRFAPTFLHNLHHLLVDLSLVTTKLKENKTKTSSLGRNGSAVSGSSWRSASSKDLLSIGNNDIIPKTKGQIVTEKLHALFVTMNNLETKDSPDPYQPEALLQAIRDANPLFEGNQQQDAHEFFVELLSCLRVTCDELNEQIEHYPDLIKPPEPTSANVNNNSKIWGVRRSWKKPLKRKEKVSSKKNGDQENEVTAADSEDNLSTDEGGDLNKKKFGYNFIAEDFQGVSLHRTKCLECEEVSELKEPFLEIQVPVNCKDDDFEHGATESSIFGSVCVTSEKLCDQNKYFCEICNRYNEAVRTVLYEKLPNIMVLHLKRFTTSSSGVQKVNTYVPTPLEIRCFCEGCNKTEKSKTTPHKYRLSCVIMHLGASMASGHYIAYSRASVQSSDYVECARDIPKNYLNPSGKEISANILKFFKAKTLVNALSENQNGLGPNSKKNDTQVCQSITCCGIRSTKLNLCSPVHSDDWLEFDDEKVKTLSKKEFMDMLNRRQESTHTPYLLFYSKV